MNRPGFRGPASVAQLQRCVVFLPGNVQTFKKHNMAAAAQPISSADAGNACKRLQKELMGLMMSKDEGISAFPDADNILSWTATIDGAKFCYSLLNRICV